MSHDVDETDDRASALNDRALIESGWDRFRKECIPEGAPDVQLEAMKSAFYAGASFTYSSISHLFYELVMDPINEEIDGFADDMDEDAPQGSA